jgi:hypothetical protein
MRGADNSLARPGRTKNTATKLPTKSNTLPIPLLYNFQGIQKNSESCPSNQVSAVAMTSASDENDDLSIDFSFQETGGSPTGPNPESGVDD